MSHLLARPSIDRAAEGPLPSFGGHRGLRQPEVGEHRDLIDVDSDLLGAAVSGEVLSSSQRCAPTLAGKAEQIAGDQRNRPAGALLPRCVGGRVNYHLANDSPTGVVRVAARDQKPSEGLGHAGRPGF